MFSEVSGAGWDGSDPQMTFMECSSKEFREVSLTAERVCVPSFFCSARALIILSFLNRTTFPKRFLIIDTQKVGISRIRSRFLHE